MEKKSNRTLWHNDMIFGFYQQSRTKNTVDLDKALSYRLSPVPLSLATADGAIRKSAKRKLYQCDLDDLEEVSYAEIPNAQIFILDTAAAVWITYAKQCTIRETRVNMVGKKIWRQIGEPSLTQKTALNLD